MKNAKFFTEEFREHSFWTKDTSQINWFFISDFFFFSFVHDHPRWWHAYYWWSGISKKNIGSLTVKKKWTFLVLTRFSRDFLTRFFVNLIRLPSGSRCARKVAPLVTKLLWLDRSSWVGRTARHEGKPLHWLWCWTSWLQGWSGSAWSFWSVLCSLVNSFTLLCCLFFLRVGKEGGWRG